MASPHTTSQPAFLVFPALSPEYTWRVIAVETGRTISRHRNLALAITKAEELNLRALESKSESESLERTTLDSPMPDPIFTTRENFLASSIRGTCQNWYENGASDPANGYECNRPASVTDLETSYSFCVGCYQEQAR